MSVTTETVMQRYNFLCGEVRKHDELYEQNKPIISDGEYDVLFAELVQIEETYPELRTAISPTQKIYTKKVDGLQEVVHTHFMGSQEKIKDANGVEQFCNRAHDAILAQYKLDGLTCVLRYQNGLFKQAITRGTGFLGEDITHSVRTIRNVPKKIAFQGTLEVRSEIIIPYAEFERINSEIENPADAYSNPRNLASGTVRQLDASIAHKRNLQSIVFDLVVAEGVSLTTDEEQIAFLQAQGFDVVKSERFENTPEGRQALLAFIHHMEHEVRNQLPYMIDGLVIKFNQLSTREALGSTSKYPKWSISYKFASQEAHTKLLGVTWQVGKSGQITPVGELETVNIDGVNISRVSLHNYGQIQAKDIRIGDMVFVIRANDVIPHVTKSIPELRTGDESDIIPPATCPSCGSPTVFEKDLLYCYGLSCKPQLKGRLEHFGSRKALNIDGLGAKTIDKFFEYGLLENLIDLYSLQEKEEIITNLEGFGKAKFNKLIKGLEDAKKAPLSKVIYAFSINHIGESSSRAFATAFGSMEAVLQESLDVEAFALKVISLNDFGGETTNSIVDFFTNEANRQMIEKLMALGFTMQEEVAEVTAVEGIAGKTFVITGELSKPRSEFKALIEGLGGKVTGSVSKKTDYLLMGDDAVGTSKHQKAVSLDITILNEEAFLQLTQ